MLPRSGTGFYHLAVVLKVCEIFKSIQGESTRAGLPCVFVRLSGCNLGCGYCDTVYARDEGREMSVEDVGEEVARHGCPLVEITGGEPLLQPECADLAEGLLRRGMTVLVETNGTLPIDRLPDGAIRIMDLKCPGSGECDRTDWTNIDRLTRRDEVKFVVSGRNDYDWARQIIAKHRLEDRCGAVLLSPVHGKLDPRHLALWMLDDGLNARLQLQMHKFIWPPQARGV